MRNQATNRALRFLAPRILAALAVFWAALPAPGAQATLSQTSDHVVDISGGTGKEAWRLRYGTLLTMPVLQSGEDKPLLVPAEGNRAWYAYGGWLRLIDTQKGQVLGRWHFPTLISNLHPQGTTVDVEIKERVEDWFPKGSWSGIQSTDRYVTRHVPFDPASPSVPFWPDGALFRYRIPLNEAANVFESVDIQNFAHHSKVSAEQAKKTLPELEDAVRRDPFTPWFGIALGKVLMDIGDPRAPKAFQDALNSPGTDFTELLRISAFLDGIGKDELARAAFERGYQDFWTKGNDPRLFLALIGRLFLYPHHYALNDPGTESGRESVERDYRLAPYCEGAELAWRLYADYWKQQGQDDRARLWQARFEDTRRNGFSFLGSGDPVDRTLLVILGAFSAIVLYWLVLFLRYRPQRRLDQAAGQRVGRVSKGFVFFNAEYWSRAERFAFFIMVFVLWVAIGLFGQDLQSILRRASTPIGSMMGNFGGPEAVNMLETDWLPPSPYRDFLLAFAYQEDGQTEKAEGLYRKLPKFAESWNNLGVILRSAGKDQEAKQAFEKALQLDPTLSEAALNLGRPPADLWAEMHQKYLPGQPMLAPPRGIQWDRAFLGGSPAKIYLRALLGPFSVQDPAGLFGLVGKLFG